MYPKKELLVEHILEDHIPMKAVTDVRCLLKDANIFLKIVRPRKTLQGTYRPSRLANQRHIITINNDLNPYIFLITLLHEIAHAHAWTNYKAKGHQKEWKFYFKQLLNHFIELGVFPYDIQIALESHVKKVKYSDIVDINLTRTLRFYDKKTTAAISNFIPLNEIPKNTVFLHNGKIFCKGELLRKYILCKNLNNKRMYRCHPLMMVSIVEDISL